MTSFFDQSTDQSRVKAAIVANYFWAWAKVIISVAKKGRDRPWREVFVVRPKNPSTKS